MRRALDLLRSCDCASEKGCPGCIQYTACNQYNAVLSKAAAEIVLAETIAAEEVHRAGLREMDTNNVVGMEDDNNDNSNNNNNMAE